MGGLNLYRYVANNPLKYVDAYGYYAEPGWGAQNQDRDLNPGMGSGSGAPDPVGDGGRPNSYAGHAIDDAGDGSTNIGMFGHSSVGVGKGDDSTVYGWDHYWSRDLDFVGKSFTEYKFGDLWVISM